MTSVEAPQVIVVVTSSFYFFVYLLFACVLWLFACLGSLLALFVFFPFLKLLKLPGFLFVVHLSWLSLLFHYTNRKRA